MTKVFRLIADCSFEADGIEDAMVKIAAHFVLACGPNGAPTDFLLPESEINLEVDGETVTPTMRV